MLKIDFLVMVNMECANIINQNIVREE